MSWWNRLGKWLAAPMTRTVKLAPWFDPVEPAVTTALQVAERDGRETASLDDLLWALSFDDEIEDFFRSFGIDVEKAQDLLALAREGPVSDKPREGIMATRPSGRVIAALRRSMTRVLLEKRESVSATDLFLAILTFKDAAGVEALARLQLTRFSATTFIAHGVTAHRLDLTSISDTGEALVIMWNDDFTPMEFVLAVLIDFFGLDDGEARGVMMEIHNHGKATVAIWPSAKAKKAVIDVLAKATDSDVPLRVTLEPAHT